MVTMQNRLLFSDLLRILAIFGAILIHVSAANIDQVPVESTAFFSFNIYDSLARFCVPIFVMLSGMLFLNPNKDIKTKAFFIKYIPRIILALFFYGVVYFILISYLETGVLDFHFIKDGFISVCSGNARYHLWYLYMIVGLYLITPFLRVFTAKATKKEIEYFLLLFLLVSSVLFTMEKFSVFQFVSNLVEQMKLSFLYGYMGYYMLGYYLHHFSLSIRATRILYVLGLLSIPFTILITNMLSISANEPVVTFYSYFSLNVILMSASLFLFMQNSFKNTILPPNLVKIISTIAKCSFTMYLIHDFFLIVLSRIGINTLSSNPVFSPLLLAASVFILSFTVSFILNFLVTLFIHSINNLILSK